MQSVRNTELEAKSYAAREAALKQLEAFANLGSWEVNLHTNISTWSDQNYKIYGFNKETTSPTLELFYERLVNEDVERAKKTLSQIMLSGEVKSFECSIRTADGTIKNLVLNAKVVYNEDNTPLKVIGTSQDISEFKYLQKKATSLSNIMQNTQNEIYIINATTQKYLYANDGACNALGYTIKELLNMDIYDINPNLTKEQVLKLISNNPSEDDFLKNRTTHKRKDGTEYFVQSYIHAIVYENVNAYVIFDSNITAQKELEDKLEHQATHDVLTNLPNRILFNDRLSQLIKTSNRDSRKFALLFIDLDQFKSINDSLGHSIGDEVLKEIAYRLRKSIRGADTLARLGGDEFTIILRNLKESTVISRICKKISLEIKKPIILKEHNIYVSASIGISEFPKDALVDSELIKYADAAMYQAKDDGRDTHKFFCAKLSEKANEKMILENSLKTAVKENQFIVYYQPQYKLSEGTIIGMEALVRWEHPTIGLIPPNKFIPIAEENGLIVELDRIVMKTAMKEFAQWHKQGFTPGKLALNLAMKQLNKDDFIQVLIQNMNEFNFKPEWLELEVTESQVMANPENSIKKLKGLSSLGINIAIDDFGTGYSSLTYLKKLPLDKIKIDKSFVQDVHINEDDSAITKAIIALAKSLNLSIIAEGVEEECQKEFLQNNGCDNFQGYLFSKPLPSDKITKLLQEIKGKNAN